MANSPYSIALRRYLDNDGKARGLLVDRDTFEPSIAGSLYEASLSRRCSSPNTLYKKLQHAQAVLSWGKEKGINLDARLLAGEPFSRSEIEHFSLWLEDRVKREEDKIPHKKLSSYNECLTGVSKLSAWFVDTYCSVGLPPVERNQLIELQHQASRRVWKSVIHKNSPSEEAPDLTDDEISEIETFLVGLITCPNPKPRWIRVYLIWRLAIEFGFRIGEILALRLEDCPTRLDPSFRIVRVANRNGPLDPRGIYAPRPKTLGRSLAPILSNTAFPKLYIDYQADHRLKRVRRANGQVIKRPIISHGYLITNDGGEPLPVSTAESYAQAISRETGIAFNWHLARHAFFNRAYAAVARLDDPTARTIRTADLVYWGGWADDESIKIYIRRELRERAKSAIAIWGQQNNQWNALG